jgi:hypothetical protein
VIRLAVIMTAGSASAAPVVRLSAPGPSVDTTASLAGQPPIRGCHEGRRLFAAGELNRREAQRFDDVEISLSGHPKELS